MKAAAEASQNSMPYHFVDSEMTRLMSGSRSV